jgi:protein involved in polysaccharide export with SLBB domain
MWNLWILAGMVLLAPLLAAQAEPGSANLPAQAIGAMDLLAISVYGAPELTRSVRVSDEGQIRLPMVRQRIDVGDACRSK